MTLNKPRWKQGERWESFIDHVADIPWGLIAFLIIAVLILWHVLRQQDIDNAKALLPAAGLLGVGHGLHTGSKHLRR